MTREVKVYGKRLRVYRVRGCSTAWCSDRNLANKIGEKHEKSLRKLRLNKNEVKALVRL